MDMQRVVEELQSVNAKLEIIQKAQKQKTEHIINVTSQTSLVTVRLKKPIQSDQAFVGLKALFMYYNIPNVSTNNNVFKFEFNGSEHIIPIPEGAYEVEDLESVINDSIKNIYFYTTNEISSEVVQGFKITGDFATCRAKIEVPKGFKVDFSVQNSIGKTLGFKSVVLSEGIHTSENLVDINPVNCITVCCDIAEGEIKEDGAHGDGIYTFFPTELPGDKINREVENVQFLPVRNGYNYIDSITLSLKDDNGRIINNRGEKITMVLALRS